MFAIRVVAFIFALSSCGGPAEAEPLAAMWEPRTAVHLPAPLAVPTRRLPANFCVITHYSSWQAPYAGLAHETHKRYAQRHGYVAKAFIDRISGDEFVDPSRGGRDSLWGGGLFWQKITAMRMALRDGIEDDEGRTRHCEWALWLDSDAVITDLNVRLESLADEHAGLAARTVANVPIDVVLSSELDHPLNAGVFMVRNTEVGMAFLQAVAALYPLYKNNNLPEQTAMGTVAYVMEPWPSDTASEGVMPALHPSIAVVPQRTWNSFYSGARRWPESVQWVEGDFVAHLAGVPHADRPQVVQQLAVLAGIELPQDEAASPSRAEPPQDLDEEREGMHVPVVAGWLPGDER